MNAELGDIKAFVAVATTGSFNAAANSLNLSQPALSRRIDKLEAALGVRLLERTTRRVNLSAVGRAFLPKAEQILSDLDASLLSIREIAEHRTGEVTVACIPTGVYYFLPAAIRRFTEQFPRIRIRILDQGANQVLESVQRGEADFGITLLGSQEPDIDFDPLFEEPFVLACRRDHPLASRDSVTWRDLAQQRFVSVARSSGNRLLMDIALAAEQCRPRWFYEVQHLSTSLGLVEAGLGVSALPRSALPGPDHPILTSIPLVDPVIARTVGAIRRQKSALPPTASCFYAIIKEICAAERGGSDSGMRSLA